MGEDLYSVEKHLTFDERWFNIFDERRLIYLMRDDLIYLMRDDLIIDERRYNIWSKNILYLNDP